MKRPEDARDVYQELSLRFTGISIVFVSKQLLHLALPASSPTFVPIICAAARLAPEDQAPEFIRPHEEARVISSIIKRVSAYA